MDFTTILFIIFFFQRYRPLDPDRTQTVSGDSDMGTDHLQWESVKERVIKAGSVEKLVVRICLILFIELFLNSISFILYFHFNSLSHFKIRKMFVAFYTLYLLFNFLFFLLLVRMQVFVWK